MRSFMIGCIAISALAASSTAGDPAKKASGPVGLPAYDFSLEAIDGATVQLTELKGKVVLIDLFETWCPPCNAMMPSVVAMNAQYKDKGLVVLGIDRGRSGDTPVDVKKFIARHKIDFQVILLSGEMKETFLNKFDAGYGIPHFIAIDRKGVVRYKRAGRDRDALETAVKKLLGEKP